MRICEILSENTGGQASPIPKTRENIELAKEFLLNKWIERAKERGMMSVPSDLSYSCKFSALFAKEVFGGEISGNHNHVFVKDEKGEIFDLNIDAEDVQELMKKHGDKEGGAWVRNQYGWEDYESHPHYHDPKFIKSRDFKDSLKSCAPRVKEWVEEFETIVSKS